MPTYEQSGKDDFKKLTAGQKKEVKKIAEVLDNPGAKRGKNIKALIGNLEGNAEIRGSDGLRIVFDIATLGIRRIFKKTGHQTTDIHIK